MYCQNRYCVNFRNFAKVCAFVSQKRVGKERFVRVVRCSNERSKATLASSRPRPTGNVRLEVNVPKSLPKNADFGARDLENRTVEMQKRTQSEDFFGFGGGEGVIEVEGEPIVPEKLFEKYGKLFERTIDAEVEEKVYITTFGNIRYDMDNRPQVLDSVKGRVLDDMDHGKQAKFESNFIDEQYFGASDSEIRPTNLRELTETSAKSSSDNYIEEQYFAGTGSPAEVDGDNIFKIRPSDSRNFGQNAGRDSSDNYIEGQYFAGEGAETGNVDTFSPHGIRDPNRGRLEDRSDIQGGSGLSDNVTRRESVSSKDLLSNRSDENTESAVNFVEEHSFGGPETRSRTEKMNGSESKIALGQNVGYGDTKVTGDNDAVFATRILKAKKDTDTADVENPKTAFDYAMKLRRERSAQTKGPGLGGIRFAEDNDTTAEQKLDSKGFRLYTDQVPDLDDEPETLVLKILKDAALYDENDILAICKPYGLPVHEGAGHRHFLTKFLPDLAKHFCRDYDEPRLYTVHRLDKETTGVLLLAKTQAMAKRLSDMFAQGKVQKTYWALTKGVPSPSEGIVDIPMAEKCSDGKSRMVLKVPYTDETRLVLSKSSRRSHVAITRYKVLASQGNAALVELKPATGVRHQLRLHLASGLACPVLGDHKYSHENKLAPQKLPADILQHLGLRQSKVRTLPMHLHARGIVLPEFLDGRNVHFGARLPKHFLQNMRRLKIKVEQK